MFNTLFEYKMWANRDMFEAVSRMHGGYHRGAVGRILADSDIQPPADTLAGFWHQTQPERREPRQETRREQ
ncbi:hypothetical protein L4174_006050 [Photobacterium sp. CCB-ST2H9]|uniref:hypothetical protein n=1 Tax=Photobacterium sp. CCB-ST2H9 TaxID=2912855 RepID=UPI002002BA46|nr:hypothetical protein [Photobacterium sp. CCB-ST2H9]UTM58397.1 hypothetical protein L4174_006050 [Photobacterium sp. CCB-ST2H9]